MGPVVRSLILKRFRSVPTGRIDFDNPTFLVGRNGSGKSNLADAFAFISEAMVLPLQEVFDRRGGIANTIQKSLRGDSRSLAVAIEVELGEILKNGFENFQKFGPLLGDIQASKMATARYALEIGSLPEYRFEVIREQCVFTRFDGSQGWFDRKTKQLKTNVGPLAGETMDLLSGETLALPTLPYLLSFAPIFYILRGMRTYSIDPHRLKEMQDPDSGTSLKRDGSNAASVLDEIKRRAPGDAERIYQFLSAIIPDTSAVSTGHYGNKLALEFTQEWNQNGQLKFDAFNMSDGTLRAVGLLLAVFQRQSPFLMIVEEPEASIHPGAVGVILDLLRGASKRMQVVVSTHSPEILDAKWIEDKHLRIVTWQKGSTHVSNVSEMSRKALQQHLMGAGELLRSEALQSGALFEDVDQVEPSLFEEVS